MFNKIWNFIAIAGITGACFLTKADPMTWLLSLTGIVFVLGVSSGWKYAQFLGAALVAMYGYLSYSAGFYGNMAVNLAVILPMQLYGAFQWVRTATGDNVTIRSLSSDQKVYIAYAASALSLVGVSLCYMAESKLPIHDGVSAALVIVATLLMVLRCKEQWWIWIPYNILECFMWFFAASVAPEILAVFVMRVIFLINSLIGFYNWSRK